MVSKNFFNERTNKNFQKNENDGDVRNKTEIFSTT